MKKFLLMILVCCVLTGCGGASHESQSKVKIEETNDEKRNFPGKIFRGRVPFLVRIILLSPVQ